MIEKSRVPRPTMVSVRNLGQWSVQRGLWFPRGIRVVLPGAGGVWKMKHS